MLPKESGVPEGFNIYFRSILGNLFQYTVAPLENTCSFSKGIDETQAVIGKFELYPGITMLIFALNFLKLETKTLSHVSNKLMSNQLTCSSVSCFRPEKCILIFDEIKFGNSQANSEHQMTLIYEK